MIKIIKGSEFLLEDIAEKHWDWINHYMDAEERYSEYSLTARINRKIAEHQAAGNVDRAAFYLDLLADDEALLKEIILCKPDDTEALIVKVDAMHRHYGLEPTSSDAANFGYELLNEVFQYENWRNSKKSENLFLALGIDICPYCNMQGVWFDRENDLLVVTYDHYYDKSTYPYLSLSFYNLIPACQPCNLTYKHATPFRVTTHLHPYLDNYNQINTFDHNYIDSAKPFDVNITTDALNNRSGDYNRDLGIRPRYNLNMAKLQLEVLLSIHNLYSESTREQLKTNWGLIDEHEVDSRICKEHKIPFQEADILNRQYGKLIRDFALKIGFFATDNPLLQT
jgi:hypothetical protein